VPTRLTAFSRRGKSHIPGWGTLLAARCTLSSPAGRAATLTAAEHDAFPDPLPGKCPSGPRTPRSPHSSPMGLSDTGQSWSVSAPRRCSVRSREQPQWCTPEAGVELQIHSGSLPLIVEFPPMTQGAGSDVAVTRDPWDLRLAHAYCAGGSGHHVRTRHRTLCISCIGRTRNV